MNSLEWQGIPCNNKPAIVSQGLVLRHVHETNIIEIWTLKTVLVRFSVASLLVYVLYDLEFMK